MGKNVDIRRRKKGTIFVYLKTAAKRRHGFFTFLFFLFIYICAVVAHIS